MKKLLLALGLASIATSWGIDQNYGKTVERDSHFNIFNVQDFKFNLKAYTITSGQPWGGVDSKQIVYDGRDDGQFTVHAGMKESNSSKQFMIDHGWPERTDLMEPKTREKGDTDVTYEVRSVPLRYGSFAIVGDLSFKFMGHSLICQNVGFSREVGAQWYWTIYNNPIPRINPPDSSQKRWLPTEYMTSVPSTRNWSGYEPLSVINITCKEHNRDSIGNIYSDSFYEVILVPGTHPVQGNPVQGEILTSAPDEHTPYKREPFTHDYNLDNKMSVVAMKIFSVKYCRPSEYICDN